MGSVYQNTFWVAVAILAVLLPVYVLAVSLLGRAIGIARKQKQDIVAEQQARAEAVTAEAQQALDAGETIELRKRLVRAEQEEKKAAKRAIRVEKRYNQLRLWPSVGLPGALLTGAITLVMIASGLADLPWVVSNYSGWPVLLWSISVVLIVASVTRVLLALQIVQEVSLSTDEASLLRTTEALKKALSDIEEAKRPEISIVWRGNGSPIHVSPLEEFDIVYFVNVTKGEVARSVIRTMFIPPRAIGA